MIQSVVSLDRLESFQQKNNQPKVYKKVNAYTHHPSFQQILTVILFIVHFTMHCIFLIRPIFGISHPILFFIWALYLLSIIIVIFDYFYLTCGDPVDKLLAQPSNVAIWQQKSINYHKKLSKSSLMRKISKNSNNSCLSSDNPFQLKECKACNRIVKWDSYHCWTCKRCVEYMDHHCKYLNNCIGGRNYYAFFRLLSFSIFTFLLGTIIGIWVFVKDHSDSYIESLSFNRWAVLVFIIFTILLSVVVQILYFFHCYISCCLKMSTVQYLYRDSPSNGSSQNQLQSASPLPPGSA